MEENNPNLQKSPDIVLTIGSLECAGAWLDLRVDELVVSMAFLEAATAVLTSKGVAVAQGLFLKVSTVNDHRVSLEFSISVCHLRVFEGSAPLKLDTLEDVAYLPHNMYFRLGLLCQTPSSLLACHLTVIFTKGNLVFVFDQVIIDFFLHIALEILHYTFDSALSRFHKRTPNAIDFLPRRFQRTFTKVYLSSAEGLSPCFQLALCKSDCYS